MFVAKVRSELWTLRGKRAGGPGPVVQRRYRRHRAIAGHRRGSEIFWKQAPWVTAYDPRRWRRAREVLPPSKKLHYASDAYQAAQDADAVLILTDWKELPNWTGPAQMKWSASYRDRRTQSYKPATMLEKGFTYVSVGRAPIYHEQNKEERKWHRRGRLFEHRQMRVRKRAAPASNGSIPFTSWLAERAHAFARALFFAATIMKPARNPRRIDHVSPPEYPCHYRLDSTFWRRGPDSLGAQTSFVQERCFKRLRGLPTEEIKAVRKASFLKQELSFRPASQ